MSTPHRATPEHWRIINGYGAGNCFSSTIRELRARIEALEAAQQQVSELQAMHNVAVDWRMEQDARLRALESPQQPTVKESLTPAPAGSLVERLTVLLEPYGDRTARAAIREVAAWLRSEYPMGAGPAWANLLEQEANR